MSYYLGTPPPNRPSPEPSFTNDPAPPWAPPEDRGSYTQPPPYERPPAPVYPSQWSTVVSRPPVQPRGGGIPAFILVNPLNIAPTLPILPFPTVMTVPLREPRGAQQTQQQVNAEGLVIRQGSVGEKEEDIDSKKISEEDRVLENRRKAAAAAAGPVAVKDAAWLQKKREYLNKIEAKSVFSSPSIEAAKEMNVWRSLRDTVEKNALVRLTSTKPVQAVRIEW